MTTPREWLRRQREAWREAGEENARRQEAYFKDYGERVRHNKAAAQAEGRDVYCGTPGCCGREGCRY